MSEGAVVVFLILAVVGCGVGLLGLHRWMEEVNVVATSLARTQTDVSSRLESAEREVRHSTARVTDVIARLGIVRQEGEAALGEVLQRLDALSKEIEEHNHPMPAHDHTLEQPRGHVHFWVSDGDPYMGPRGKEAVVYRCDVPGCNAKAIHERGE